MNTTKEWWMMLIAIMKISITCYSGKINMKMHQQTSRDARKGRRHKVTLLRKTTSGKM